MVLDAYGSERGVWGWCMVVVWWLKRVLLLLELLPSCGREKEERNKREKVPCKYLVKNEVK